MELNLQFGYGMMDHSRSLIEQWGGGTVILSPRDLSANQLSKLAKEIGALQKGAVLLDPQFYLPHADHERLNSHDYWPDSYSTSAFWSGSELRTLLSKLDALNRSLGCHSLIAPGLYADRVDDDWLARQKVVLEEATAALTTPVLATVALSADAVRSDQAIEDILASAEAWEVAGIYLVCEHPNGDYIVTDPTWLTNVLDLVAGFRLKGKQVIVGYSNHQMLALSCVGANALASGTWMNVRSFPPDKFRTQYEDEIKQRATWYYCPQALSEYKIPFLDIAMRQGVLAEMAPPAEFESAFAWPLFAGSQPTSVGWSEQAAFRHYLQCLWHQTKNSHRVTFDETCAEQERALDAADVFLTRLHTAGVRGQLRDFKNAVDANRAALAVIKSSRGPLLRRKWSVL